MASGTALRNRLGLEVEIHHGRPWLAGTSREVRIGDLAEEIAGMLDEREAGALELTLASLRHRLRCRELPADLKS